MTYQTYLTSGGSCCLGGFHTAAGSSTAPQTYLHFTWITGPFLTFGEDIAAVSHEAGEWMDDPFVDNATPCFANPNGSLEVGDHLVLFDFPVVLGGVTYHPQDLTFVSYFTGAFPSKGVNKQFTFRGNYHFPCSFM